MNFYLHPDIKKQLSSTQPLFDQLMALRGDVFRSQKGRVTQRIMLGDKTYFIKQHAGVGWKEIVKNMMFGRAPILGARNEWQAIKKLDKLGITVPTLLGYGERGVNPAQRESFVLMEDVTPATSLEDICGAWSQSTPDIHFKRALIKRVANIARTLHQHGVNHRDFYICHFLLMGVDRHSSAGWNSNDKPLYLIDLHRAQIRNKTPIRWIIKDLAGLYFSSKDIGLTKRDYYRFMKVYSNLSLRSIVKTQQHFWKKVEARGSKLYRDHQ